MRTGQATAEALARAVGLCLLMGALCACGTSRSQAPASAAPSWTGGPWLGLNDNTAKYLGAVPAFARFGISYDRSFELTAGMLPGELDRGGETSELSRRLREDHQYGMVPMVVIEYRGYDRTGFEYTSDPEFPQQRTAAQARAGHNTIAAYAAGFARSAAAFLAFVHARYPGMEVLFEAMNEPWGYTQPRYNAAEYADVVAQVLPAALEAGVPADTIYVAATGADCSPGPGVQSSCHPGWVRGMYAAQPQLRSEIQGWYLHPYGPSSGTDPLDDEGIETLPTVRSWMYSGEDNIVVSEVGFCAEDVDNPAHVQGGDDCHGLRVATSAEAAADLTVTLQRARSYHEAGWLRALIVYSRNDGGWAMQRFPALTLTPSGAALETFALLDAGL